MNLRYLSCFLNFISTQKIGELLFNESVKCGKFDCNSNSTIVIKRCLNLLAYAYPHEFIHRLNLRSKDEFLFLSPIIKKCLNITHLDLSSSDLNDILNDSDSNLVDMLKASASQLESLNVSNNNLGDNFVKKFTLPQRLLLVNFAKLTRLNLSHNPDVRLHVEMVNNLKKFPLLNEIIMDKNQLSDLNHQDFYGLNACVCDTDLVNRLQFENSGWISKIKIQSLISNKISTCLDTTEGFLLSYV